MNTAADFQWLKVAVPESGIGMSTDQVKFGGTVLGSAIARKPFVLMGSEVQVERPGRVLFFVYSEGWRAEMTMGSKAQTNHSSYFDKSGAKVLVAEDNRVNQVVASGFLKQWGIEADFADHGLIALEMIRSRKYHMVLMDLQMPEMDGYQTSMKIRSLDDSYFKHIPIIALTAGDMVEVRDLALQAGMTDFLSKPFNPDDFKRVVFRHLQAFSSFKPIHKRELLNFSEFTCGDADFEKELARAVLDNLYELKISIRESLKAGGRERFDRTLHKMKTSLSIITDPDFIKVLDDLKALIPANGDITPELREKLRAFGKIHQAIVSELKLRT